MPFRSQAVWAGYRRLMGVLMCAAIAFCLLGPAAVAQAGTTPVMLPDALPWTPTSPAYRIHVSSDGLYRMDYAYLAAAGLPVGSIDPSTFRMFYMGDEIPIRVDDGGDGVFDNTDAIYFYGRGVDSLYWDGLLPTNKYTAASVFWLSYGGAPGLRMASRASATTGTLSTSYPRREHIERQFWYRSAQPYLVGADHWFADPLSSSSTPATRSYSFSASNLAAGSHTGRLKVSVVGYRLGPHHLRVLVNDVQVFDDTVSWIDFGLFQPEFDFDQALLVEGANTVKVQLISDVGGKTSDAAYVDWVDVTYADSYLAESDQLPFSNPDAGDWQYSVDGFSLQDIDVYDVSTLTGVTRITGSAITGSGPYAVVFSDSAAEARRYLALTSANYRTPLQIEAVTYNASAYTPGNLVSAQNGADYIIVTHPDFWAQALRLAAHRAKRYRVALVDVRQVYDQYNGGQMSAEAIRDFLGQAYRTWLAPAPAYVVLLGDGNYDMRNYKGNSGSTYLPPFLELADPDLGETAADNRFVTLAGEDTLPEMHIGRLVANTSDQAKALIDKIIDYETVCQCNGWSFNTLFVSDDLEGGGGDFYEYSDKVAYGYADPPANTVPLIPGDYKITKAYLGLTCDITGNPSPANQCRQQILDTLNNDGALFVSYVGHSTKTEWAAERLMDSALIASMTNGVTHSGCLPVNLAMTCYEGSFHEIGIGVQSLAEIAVRTPVNGAVASWSPTGFGLVSGHDYLETGFFLAVFQEGIQQLGRAITWAKEYLWTDEPFGQHRDLVDTFVLLGDPALELKTAAICLSPTAVRMVDFGAARESKRVRIHWESADESDALGFNVLRRDTRAADNAFVAINKELLLAQHTGLSQGAGYEFYDRLARLSVSYEYMLEIVKLDGETERFGQARVQQTNRWTLRPLLEAR